MYEHITISSLPEKILLLLPVLATRLSSSQTQLISDAYAMQREIPLNSRTDLRSFTSLVESYLSATERINWNEAWETHPHHWLCHDTYLARPHLPYSHRCIGPGKDNPRVSARHDRPSPFLMIHFSWNFLTRADRTAVIQSHNVMKDYAKLRCSATMRNLTSLRSARKDPTKIPALCKRRAWIIACALIRFDFVYADLIRWLGGEYTNDHRDWKSVFQYADHVCKIPVPNGSPPIDLERAIHIATSGAPIAGHFECKFDDVERREMYDNHPPLQEALDAVRKKFAKEEGLSYTIALPRFLWGFIYGLFISPLSFVVRRPGEDGRICPDPSNTIHPSDTGAANAYIPNAGLPGAEDENPAVYYGTAFTRLLTWIWNLRIDRPGEDILGHVDDISAAYHRCLYHPAMGVVFAQIFQEFLMIPCGLIFGAKSSPAWYMLPAELRSHLASAGDYGALSSALAKEIELPPQLTPRQKSRLASATADQRHRGTSHHELPHQHNSFVDDTVTAAWPEKIRTAVNQSVLSSYVIFGFPKESRRPPPLNPSKWDVDVSAVFKYLGFIVDTAKMIVIWPLDKRKQLATWIDEIWLNNDTLTVTPKQASQLLGLIRHGAIVCPLGLYLSLRLQFELNDFISGRKKVRKSWWTAFRFKISNGIKAELRILRRQLDDNLYHPTWCRLIGLMIQRDTTAIPVSDASYEGLGGLCRAFPYVWRLSANNLRKCGWKLCGDGKVDEGNFSPKCADDEAHINILEFLAIIINLWMLLKLMDNRTPANRKHHVIASFFADNTSALSWLSHASRTKRTKVRNLARFLTSMLLHHDFPIQVAGFHIPGTENRDTDCLSRFLLHPSWASLTNDASLDFQNLQAYHVPPKLLSLLWSVASNKQIVDTSGPLMTQVWRLELKPLPAGWQTSISMTSL